MIILKHLWAFPLTLIGLILWPVYGTRWIKWTDGALSIGCKRLLGFKTTSGQTWGGLMFFKYANKDTILNSRIWNHERRHVTQAFVGGIFFGIAYLADSGWKLFRPGKFMDLRQAYLDNIFEVDARKHE